MIFSRKKIFYHHHNSVFLVNQLLKLYKSNMKFLSTLLRNRLITKYGIHISLGYKIGKNIHFPHPHGIIIGKGSSIGENCILYHNVSLGKRTGKKNPELSDYPSLGNNVIVFTGAVIIGSVNIGDNAVIGDNRVVTTDFEENTTYAGIPVKKCI